MAEKKLQPIIIKRIKKGGHAAHGGAWKIAYADFVTAMMAFFLLMWLINTTDPEQKRGIAEYFDIDPVAVRVAYVLLTLFTAFSGVLAYIILWIVMPQR